MAETKTETKPAETETKPSGNGTAKKPPAPVYTPEHPEYPKLLYNTKTRATKSATDKDHEAKLGKDGFGEDPPPPLDPNALSADEVKEFQGLLAKVSKYVASLPTTEPPILKQNDTKHNEPPKHNDVHHRV